MKRLFRSRSDRKISGVCGGLGNYLGIDPTLLRIAFLCSVIFWGIGLITYLILWVVIPGD